MDKELKEIRKTVYEKNENINKETKYSKEWHGKSGAQKYKMEIKNSLEEFNSTFEQEERRISKLV